MSSSTRSAIYPLGRRAAICRLTARARVCAYGFRSYTGPRRAVEKPRKTRLRTNARASGGRARYGFFYIYLFPIPFDAGAPVLLRRCTYIYITCSTRRPLPETTVIDTRRARVSSKTVSGNRLCGHTPGKPSPSRTRRLVVLVNGRTK